MGKILAIAVSLIMITSCTKMKEKVGITTTGPDEYKVQRGKALEIPPHYDLPVPTTPKAPVDEE